MDAGVVVGVAAGAVVPVTGLVNVGCDEEDAVAAEPGELGTIDGFDGTLEDGTVDPSELDAIGAGDVGAAVTLDGEPAVPGDTAPLGGIVVAVDPDGADNVVEADGLVLPMLGTFDVVVLPTLGRFDVVVGVVEAVGVESVGVGILGFELHGWGAVIVVGACGVVGVDADDG